MTEKSKYKRLEDDPLAGYCVLERAEIILGPRLTSDSISYKVDGKRVSIYQVIQAAGLELGRE